MEDLRIEVAKRMKTALHGRQIDNYSTKIEIPQMLGIVGIDETASIEDKNGTILNADHHFWEEWHEDIISEYSVNKHVESAIRSLTADGHVSITYPYDEDSDIAYVEVDVPPQAGEPTFAAPCNGCGKTIQADVSIEGYQAENYYVEMCVDCPDCGYSGTFETQLTRQ